jgi:hypothetical protein
MDKELKERDKAQAKQLREVKKRWLRELEAEPKVKCTVRNHDFINQGVPIEFVYKRIKSYKFKDGETVEIPISVYEHINSIKVPDPIHMIDPATGQITKEANRTRARFTAVLEEGSLSDIIKAKAPRAKEASQ